MRRLHMLLVVLAIPAGMALAQPRAGETILAGCRQGACIWLQVARVEPVTRVAQGALVRIAARRGVSLHPEGDVPRRPDRAEIEWHAETGEAYAFCSTRRPAYAFWEEGEEGLIVHFLDLFDLGGYQYSSAGMYMRLCHGRASLPSAAALRRLGYRPGTRSEQVENGSRETMTRF